MMAYSNILIFEKGRDCNNALHRAVYTNMPDWNVQTIMMHLIQDSELNTNTSDCQYYHVNLLAYARKLNKANVHAALIQLITVLNDQHYYLTVDLDILKKLNASYYMQIYNASHDFVLNYFPNIQHNNINDWLDNKTDFECLIKPVLFVLTLKSKHDSKPLVEIPIYIEDMYDYKHLLEKSKVVDTSVSDNYKLLNDFQYPKCGGIVPYYYQLKISYSSYLSLSCYATDLLFEEHINKYQVKTICANTVVNKCNFVEKYLMKHLTINLDSHGNVCFQLDQDLPLWKKRFAHYQGTTNLHELETEYTVSNTNTWFTDCEWTIISEKIDDYINKLNITFNQPTVVETKTIKSSDKLKPLQECHGLNCLLTHLNPGCHHWFYVTDQDLITICDQKYIDTEKSSKERHNYEGYKINYEKYYQDTYQK